ncbi:chondroitinase family polysaccharide lyase [Paenibacillus mesophilus]|uniref:chondroitinase family polysaccharide lyase n=1 Tax=Paenibacillus mesophilus TaxID=2582849 RepID=UPI001305470F|nr:chondroitinase family polysaccharide lyase [Paenibacillus mesophilus]
MENELVRREDETNRNQGIADDGTFDRAESFEGEDVPAAWQAKGEGALSISGVHYKHGRQSLKWQWGRNSKLVASKPRFLEQAGRSRNGGMRIWIYMESAIEGALTFRLGSAKELENGHPRCEFEIRTHFTGWRGINIHFREDGGSGKESLWSTDTALDTMEITPPADRDEGAVFFDVVEFVDHIPASRSSDYQIPFLRQKTNKGKGGSWDRSFHFSRQSPQLPLPETISPEQVQAFATIARRMEDWVYGVNPDLSREPLQIRHEALQTFVRQGLRNYDELRLKRDDNGYITGVPLFSSRSAHGPEFGATVSRKIFLPLVFDYKINGSIESKQKALELFDHFHDQGWAAGSGLETLDHETNRNNGYFFAFFLMREHLRETGRLEREMATAHWFLNMGKTYGTPGVDYLETTADEVRTRFVYKLQVVLAMDDTPEKVRHMQGLLAWMNHALAVAPGFAGTIKHDYMGFHHRGVYMSAYAPNAYHTAALIVYLLHGTPFALSAQSVDNLRQSLLTLRTVTNKYDVPVGIGGRFPTKGGITNEILPAYAYMALAGDPIDREMAAVFMRLWEPESDYLKEKLFPEASSDSVQYIDTLGGVQLMLQLADQGHLAEDSPNGCWVKPSSALAVLRREDWMVSTKGWSQYVFDFEAHGRRNTESVHKFTEGENVYGRYISYGAMQILSAGSPINAVDSGYALDHGWDWRRWPGTTAKRVPLEEMKVGKNGSENGMFNENTRSFSDESFVGGVTSEDRDGIFAMKLHDTVFDPSFRAVKSYFYFGSQIVALGTNICNEDDEHRTETTLFQSYMPEPRMPIEVQSIPINQFPYIWQNEKSGPVWFTDPYGNGYIVPDPRGLHIERDIQQSIDHRGVHETTGSYTTAWIDHGLQPHGAEYEYAILIQTTPDKLAEFASNPPYKVVSNNGKAHIVEHAGMRATGYAVFDETADLAEGLLSKTSAPITAFVKERAGSLVVSVADPDLRLPRKPNQRMEDHVAWTESKAEKVTIELQGKWKIREQTKGEFPAVIAEYGDSSTIIEFVCRNGDTTELVLIEYRGNER